MSELHNAKLKEVLRELAGEFFSRVSNRQSLITVTDIDVAARATNAKILITVLPEEAEQGALAFMQRQLSDFREYVGQRARLMRVPYFTVAIDKGEKNRQRLDQIKLS